MPKFTCSYCEKNCGIKIIQGNKQNIVTGNQCLRGFALANRQYGDQLAGNFIQGNNNYSDEAFGNISSSWDIDFSRSLPHIDVQGSPQRSEFRTVIEDQSGNLYILEQINSLNINRKESIAKILEKLNSDNLPVVSYRKNIDDEYVTKYVNKYWMLSPFISGMPLDRASYWQEKWRGSATAQFLIQLQTASRNLNFSGGNFDLPGYIDKLMTSLQRFNGNVFQQALPIYKRLEERLFPNYTFLPTTFCHGDPHPMNMIWGENKINAVIDWEFCGKKPEIYDIALIIGCVGSEAKEAIHSDFIKEFLFEIQDELIENELSIEMLPDFIVAIRFAWLAEWLRIRDNAMIEFEINYMQFLVKETWRDIF